MEKLTLKEIIQAVDGEFLKEGKEVVYEAVSTDTRSIEKNSIFIALRGTNFNGNDYAVEASKKGARVCIIDETAFRVEEFSDEVSVIKVKDTKQALLSLAEYYRSKLSIKVIGITGSTGKTSTKDIVAAVLSSKYKVFKTKGNFNNEIGLPLMIFKLDNEYDVAVLEMGMSNFGEIHNLAKTAKPDIAIITNIGVSHIEFLKSRENILKAKMEITDFFESNNSLIINSDNDLLKGLNNLTFNLIKIGTEAENIDFKADEIVLKEDSINFRIIDKHGFESPEFTVNIPGKHNVLNTLLAVACGKLLGLSYEQMIEGVENLEFTSMRLDIVKGSKFTIIDDSYNASPDSMKAAIDVLLNFKGNRKIAILGTMKELGNMSYELHKDIGRYAKEKDIDLLIVSGEFAEAYIKGFEDTKKVFSFEDNERICDFLKNYIEKDDVILVKASRSMKFEKIVNNLKVINS